MATTRKSFNSTRLEWLLDAVLMAVPLTSLYGSLDYVVHLQFSFDKDFGWERIVSRVLPVGFSLFGFSLLALRFKHLAIVQYAFALGAFAAGAALIHFSTDDGTFGAMLKTPGLAVLWIYLVIELDLALAAVSLLCTALYYYRDTVARLLLLRSLSPEEILPLTA